MATRALPGNMQDHAAGAQGGRATKQGEARSCAGTPASTKWSLDNAPDARYYINVRYIRRRYIERGYLPRSLEGGTMDETPHAAEGLLPLTPAVFHILLALSDGERHGYGIMQEIAARTHGKFRLGPGTLYGSIKRMLADGAIVETDARPDPALDYQPRRYYRLTPLRQRVHGAAAERLPPLLRIAPPQLHLPAPQ